MARRGPDGRFIVSGAASDVEGNVHESTGQIQPTDSPEVEAERAIVQEIRDEYEFGRSYYQLQRTDEAEQLEFEGVDMWSEDARNARKEQTDADTGAKIAAKPTISVNLLDQTIQQVVNEARQARLAVTVKPKAGLANTKTSNHLKGLVRSIQVQSGSLEVRLWGLERAAKVGRGGYRITADYAQDGDFDLDLMLERILDYSTVIWDPYAIRADRSDADWCIETDFISEAERKRRWPNKPILAPADAFNNDENDWFAVDKDSPKHRRVRIVTRHKVEHTYYTLGYHPQFGQGWIDQAPPHVTDKTVMPPEFAAQVKARAEGTVKRDVDARSVMTYIIDGTQVLEIKPWRGRYIPVIEVIGKEYFVKGKRRWKGIIANGMDLLRAVNVTISAAVELAGTMPRAPYIMAAGQDENFETMWDDAAVKNFMRLYYNPVAVDGKLAPPPARQQREPEVQGLMFLLRMMLDLYHAVTGTVAPQLRAVNASERSGKFVEALQRQGAAGTSNYLDNLATISMLHEGRVLIDAIPGYYDRPGRIVNVMGEESDDESAIMVNQPYVLDQDTGQPVPVPCQACQGTGQQQQMLLGRIFGAQPAVCHVCQGSKLATREHMPQEWQGQPVEFVDFSEGQYKVQPSIDRDYQTKQQEALNGMAQLAEAVPQMVPMYADLWVRSMGFSGSGEIADRIKAQNPALATPDGLRGVPQAFVARFQALQMQHKQAMQALEEAKTLLNTDAMKAAGQKEIAMIRGAMAEQLERIKQQGRMMEVGATVDADARLEVVRGDIQSMQQEAEHKHEILLQLLKELGAKEQERHSVQLHDAAAARAAERADLSASAADVRREAMAERSDTRADRSAEAARADARQAQSDALAAERAAESAARRDAKDDPSES